MAMNRVQFQRGLSMAQFMERYGSEERCEAELAAQRTRDLLVRVVAAAAGVDRHVGARQALGDRAALDRGERARVAHLYDQFLGVARIRSELALAPARVVAASRRAEAGEDVRRRCQSRGRWRRQGPSGQRAGSPAPPGRRERACRDT